MSKIPLYAKASLILIGMYAFVTILFRLQDILIPIIFATILAIVLSPLVHFLEKIKINKIVAITISLIIVLVLVVSAIFLLTSQASSLAQAFPKLADKFQFLLDRGISWFSGNFNVSTGSIRDWISTTKNEWIGSSQYLIGQTLLYTGNLMVILVLIPVYIFMILYYTPLLLEFIHNQFKSTDAVEVDEVLIAIKRIVKNYLVGLLLETGIMAVLYYVSLLILGIDFAILLAVISALINIIPYIGGIAGVIFPAAIALTTKSPTYALIVVLIYIGVQQIDNHYIRPRIVGSKVKINALVSVIVVIAGEELWGMSGMLLSIPLTAIAKVIFDHITPLKPLGGLLGDRMPRSS